MKLTTWNCARGFDKKKALVFPSSSISPDIAVIQECSKKSTEPFAFEGYEAEWVGKNPNIGMGIFHKKGWSIRRLEETTNGIEWVVPFEVTGPENFTLIAVWACEVKGNKQESYVGQIGLALHKHPKWFTRGATVMLGDFNSNSNIQSDKDRRAWNHSKMVDELKDIDLISVYHSHEKIEHGKGDAPTFYQSKNREKPFHFDYIFAPQAWQSRMNVTVGSYTYWKPYSDHCPVTAEVSTAV